jgi:CHAT domain-containing protein
MRGAFEGPEETRSPLVREATVWMELLDLVTRRARQELSHEDLLDALATLLGRMAITPFSVEALFTMGGNRHLTDPAFANAAFEATVVLARHVGNPNLLRMVEDALGRTTPAELRQRADRLLRQGRPDLGVLAWRNLGVTLQNANDFAGAEDAHRRAWEMLLAIQSGEEYVPRTADFDLARVTTQVAEPFARILVENGRLEECIKVVDRAVAIAGLFATGEKKSMLLPPERERLAVACVRLHNTALHCETGLHRAAAVEARVTEAQQFADACRSPLASVLTRSAASVIAERRGDIETKLRLLSEAWSMADRHRRSYPYEFDKVRASQDTQSVFVWAGERLIVDGRSWEALAAFEALRGRAFLDILGLAPALPLPPMLPEELRIAKELQAARRIGLAGERGEAWGLLEVWRQCQEALDRWLGAVEVIDRSYARMVRGDSMDVTELRGWAASRKTATAVVWWMLGPEYSYQAVLSCGPRGMSSAPEFSKVPVTLSWLAKAATELQRAVNARENPSAEVFEELSLALIAPVADALRHAEVVYFCPSQDLHSLPVGALSLDGEPLSVQKNVAIVPTLSALRVLQWIDQGNDPEPVAAVFGPEFPEHVAQIAALLDCKPEAAITSASARAPCEAVARCAAIHLLCHGYHDPRDPWQSGFLFGEGPDGPRLLRGRDLLHWRLRARLATLEACDTHRRVVTSTDDSFGLARFLHLTGVPSLVMSDWEIRSDVSLRFMRTFYGSIRHPSAWGDSLGRGEAFRRSVEDVRDWVGSENTFLWAPFVLAGVAD